MPKLKSISLWNLKVFDTMDASSPVTHVSYFQPANTWLWGRRMEQMEKPRPLGVRTWYKSGGERKKESKPQPHRAAVQGAK